MEIAKSAGALKSREKTAVVICFFFFPVPGLRRLGAALLPLEAAGADLDADGGEEPASKKKPDGRTEGGMREWIRVRAANPFFDLFKGPIRPKISSQ